MTIGKMNHPFGLENIINKHMNKTKLHLGCFHKKIHGYINVDIREDVNPDIVDDICVLNKFKTESVDEIYSCHVLEHTNRSDSKKVIKRWYDVLKPGGLLRVSVPDLQATFEHYICYKDLDVLQALLYGSQKHPYDFHYMGWDEITLTRDLSNVGFKNIKRYDWRDTEHFFIDDYSQCYLPSLTYNTRRPDGKIEGKLMSLNMEAIK